MTCISTFTTKQAFKDAVKRGADPFIEDPSIVAPFMGPVSQHPALAEGRVVCVTNHPKRSWFASVCKRGGKLHVG